MQARQYYTMPVLWSEDDGRTKSFFGTVLYRLPLQELFIAITEQGGNI
jgi:hypothetical protein